MSPCWKEGVVKSEDGAWEGRGSCRTVEVCVNNDPFFVVEVTSEVTGRFSGPLTAILLSYEMN